MITIRPETVDNMLVVEASEKLTARDYEDTFIPKLDELIREYGRIRVVICFNDSFEGVELGAMWDDAKFALRHKHDFARFAIVGGPRWMTWMTKLGSHCMPGEIRVFDAAALQEAVAWTNKAT